MQVLIQPGVPINIAEVFNNLLSLKYNQVQPCICSFHKEHTSLDRTTKIKQNNLMKNKLTE